MNFVGALLRDVKLGAVQIVATVLGCFLSCLGSSHTDGTPYVTCQSSTFQSVPTTVLMLIGQNIAMVIHSVPRFYQRNNTMVNDRENNTGISLLEYTLTRELSSLRYHITCKNKVLRIIRTEVVIRELTKITCGKISLLFIQFRVKCQVLNFDLSYPLKLAGLMLSAVVSTFRREIFQRLLENDWSSMLQNFPFL